MSQLGFEPVFGSYLAVALLAMGLVGLLAVQPQFGSLTGGKRVTLLGLRLLAVLLAVLALLRPTWITTIRTPRTSVLLLLVDVSRSMQLSSGRSEQSRWQAQQNTLASSQEGLARLAKKVEIQPYAYDYRLRPLELKAGHLALPDKPLGEQTDIGTTLAEAMRALPGKRVAGAIILGDGSQTAFEPQVETQNAARMLRDNFAAPLYTVTFGLAGDAAQARDVAIDRLDEQFTVFVKNELIVRGLVRVRGYVKQDLPVQLLLIDDKGHEQKIGARTIRTDDDNRQVEVEFAYTPQTPGHYRLTMLVEKQPGELVEKNNQLDAYLTVLEGGLKVLYVYGSLPFEQKFIRRAIDASADIDLDDRYIDRRTSNRWPIDLGPDFTSGKYDAFIIGNLDEKALGEANLKALAAAVERGKGLLMLGGMSSFGRGHYRNTPVGDALPIEIDRLEGADFAETELDRFFLPDPLKPGPLKMVPTGPHPITRLSGSADNAAVWDRLPPLTWAYRFSGVKQSPGVRVLLETPDRQPLLVSGEYGEGRTLAFAGESTFLWPMHDFAKEHNRFWRQIILWLVRRDDLNRDDVWVKLDQRRFNPGSRVSIEAGAKTAAGDPLTAARLETFLIHPDGHRESLTLAPNDEVFRGKVPVTEPGQYAVETTAYEGPRLVGSAKAEFVVFDRDVELSTPAADPDLMASLSAWTRQEGGRTVTPEELPRLIGELADRPPEYEERQTRWKLGATGADAWFALLALTSLLSVEWFLRKRWRLV